MDTNFSRRHFLATIGLGTVGITTLSRCTKSSAAKKPNFIILFADDMGYGDPSCFGHPYIRTPNIDKMASEGARLTSFYAGGPVCSPSRAALLTGRNPIRCGNPGNYGADSKNGLPEEEITIAQLLKTVGYKTACFGKWHLGHGEEKYMPTSRGFDSYYGILYSNDMKKPYSQTDKPMELMENLKPVEYPINQNTLTKRYTEKAISFINENKDESFLVYMPYAMPHLPLHATDGFKEKARAGLYGAVIEEIDWSVGKILDTLKNLGLDKNTLVLFTSDNGPWNNLPPRMLQDGVQWWHTGSTGLLRGSKATTYEGGMRVPGVVRWPGVIPAERTIVDLATTMDIFPTVAKLAGTTIPNDRTYDGNDMLPLLKGTGPSKTNELYYCHKKSVQAVRVGPWKYRLSNSARADKNQFDPVEPELYHLERDCSEHYNVADDHPDLVKELDAKLRAYAKEVGGRVEG
jgi:arylsulfatase A